MKSDSNVEVCNENTKLAKPKIYLKYCYCIFVILNYAKKCKPSLVTQFCSNFKHVFDEDFLQLVR